jgi:hypothetical protein
VGGVREAGEVQDPLDLVDHAVHHKADCCHREEHQQNRPCCAVAPEGERHYWHRRRYQQCDCGEPIDEDPLVV